MNQMPTTKHIRLPRDPKESLRWLLAFAQRPLTDFRPARNPSADLPPSVMAAVQASIEQFIAAARPGMQFGACEVKPLTSDQVRDLYSQARYGLTDVATKGKTWDVPASNLSNRFGFAAGAGWLDYDGDTCDRFLLTCMDLMRREGKLISKCARTGCGTLFLRSRRARYCSKRCSRLAEAEQARSRRSTSDPDLKRKLSEQRRRHYEAWMLKHGYSPKRVQALHKAWLAKQKSKRKSESGAR